MQPQSAASRVAVRAAQYVRMSTDHQRYSIDNQVSAIASYAAQNNIEIVRTYADEGRSGVQLKGRLALSEFLADVRDRRANYKTILVYDINRGGAISRQRRSAYYEFACKLAGIEDIYCAEPFKKRRGHARCTSESDEARDGGRVQPRAICQSVSRAQAAGSAGIPSRRSRELWLTSSCNWI